MLKSAKRIEKENIATSISNTQVVRLLLDSGAEPNIKNSKEETALDLAAQVHIFALNSYFNFKTYGTWKNIMAYILYFNS